MPHTTSAAPRMAIEAPIVMMINVTVEAFRAGRMVSQWWAAPRAATMTTVKTKARGRGRSSLLRSETMVSAPSMALSPWAKLMTPVTL